jgi:two-component system cell cycle sensor histidine kinase/response regulator CckA
MVFIRDGRLVRLQEYAKLVEAPAGEPFLVERILDDVTRVHRLGEEIRRTRRLESTGDLAAATVRSFKSLCTSLENSGKLLMDTPDDVNAVRQTAGTLLKSVRRGIKHSHQFLTIVGKADRIPVLISLNEILSRNDHLLRSLAGEDIDLQMVLSPRGGLITADQQELIQLISSLVASSREALPLGGTVTIETQNTEIDTSTTQHLTEMQSGIYMQMTVSADGCVVHPERRIASNRMIVKRLGGWMETTNSTEWGNLYQVYLPRVEQFGGQARS